MSDKLVVNRHAEEIEYLRAENARLERELMRRQTALEKIERHGWRLVEENGQLRVVLERAVPVLASNATGFGGRPKAELLERLRNIRMATLYLKAERDRS